MSRKDALSTIATIPRDAEGPVFREPWEAQAFALAVHLSDSGLFTWKEWTEAFGAEIKAAQASGDPDLGDTYYEHWTRALEKLAAEKSAVSGDAMDTRTEQWRQAYLNTPHGQPVDLSAAD